jgi:peptidyl-prolyl cis-trans isomerase C
MDSLARELSVDSHRARGGLIADCDWRDLQISLRDAVRDMEVGDVCVPFANNDAWTIVRLEGRTPADPDRLPDLRKEIEGTLRAEAQRDRARAIVDSLSHVVEVQRDPKVLESIAADADDVLRGSFRRGGESPVLWIDSDEFVTEHELRGIVAEAALANSAAPFDSLLARSVRQAQGDLLLRVAAKRGGYLDRPVIRRAYESARRQAVITAYLKEFVADKIRFRHQDFEDFYQKHQNDFRGPDEVQMTVLIYDEQTEAQKVFDRLSDGEDFDYLRQQTQPGWKATASQVSKWAPVSSFSEDMRSALADLEVGDFTHPLRLGSQGWMILRLDGRRPGSVPPLKEVEMPIRKAIYQREFNSILDDVLAKLEKAVGVTRYEDRIRDYFQPSR